MTSNQKSSLAELNISSVLYVDIISLMYYISCHKYS